VGHVLTNSERLEAAARDAQRGDRATRKKVLLKAEGFANLFTNAMSIVTQPIWAVTPEKVSEAVRRIVEAARPRKVIVFGSQARGDGGEDTDLDLMVVMDVVGNQVEESVRLRRLLKGLIMAVNVLVS